MTRIPFTKMHGLGNDFIMIEDLGGGGSARSDQECQALAAKVCDRHFGVGADGLITVAPSQVADFRMRMFNPDGSEAQMCGNGIRCFARYVFDRGLTRSIEPRIETLAGVKQVGLNIVDGKVTSVKVNMGTPIFASARIPATAEPPVIKDYPLSVGGKLYSISCVSMGNPHTVTFLDEAEVDHLDLAAVGPLFERHQMFPQRTNTEFCAVRDRNTIRMRVWERGAGQTLACGTGACATAVVAIDHGLVDRRVEVVLDGGPLSIEWRGGESPVSMIGPAEYICDGEYYYGD